MKVRLIWEFEPDTSDIDEEFVDKKGIAEDLAKQEMASLLHDGIVSVDDFECEVIDDGDDHKLI